MVIARAGAHHALTLTRMGDVRHLVQWRRAMDRYLLPETVDQSVIHRPPSAVQDERRFAAEVAACLASLAAIRSA